VTITRTVAGSTATQTFNVTTAADGSFTLQDTPPAVGQYTYTASYAGSTTIAPATASQAVSVTVIPATLTMSGPSTVVLTHGLTLTGTLAFAVGTPAAGTPVTVTRTVAGSTATQTFSVTTAAGGSFTLQDTPPAVGQYTYTASYAGSATVAPATGSQLVSVTLTPATLTLSGPATVRITKSVTLTGNLAIDGTPSAGTPVTVTRTLAGSTATRTFSVTTGAGGGFSVTDTPPAAGLYTYTARYAGSATVGPATAARAVSVSRNPVSLRVAASGPATTNYEAAVKVTARLGSTYSSRSVSIYAQSLGSTARKLVKVGRVNSHGELTVSYKPRHSTTFVAAFSGDARSAPETATAVVHVRAKVTESLGGNYGTQKIGGVTYRLYHHNGHMDVYTAVYPNKSGECIKYQLAIEYRGSWQSAAPTTCGRLSSSSKIAISVPLSQSEAGYRYRIRSEYVRPGSDVSNVNNDSAWQYLIIES
jgi:hypothetical protein